LNAMFALAGTHHKRGNFEEAARLASSVLAQRTETLGRTHPDTLQCIFSLARTYHKLRRFDEAGQLAAEVRLRARTTMLAAPH
ncbi:hypothetical protein GGX14DRAFT_341135, partial [Mycena pura]